MPDGVGFEKEIENEHKFRIQTDWSDTGPNSTPFEEMNNNEPNRLSRRLNDWFNRILLNSDLSTPSDHDQSVSTINTIQDENEANKYSTKQMTQNTQQNELGIKTTNLTEKCNHEIKNSEPISNEDKKRLNELNFSKC